MEENFPKASSNDTTATKKSVVRACLFASQINKLAYLRRKSMWDQPAEILVSAGVAVPSAITSSEVVLVNTVGVSSKAIPSLFQVPFASPKMNQPKIQDELIAREIVINDADSAIRYKLTKRQTQEEIQRCSGAVVITRGKYHAPNGPADNEKPLYLHISAGAHLETTLERIKSVDVAASMVEEMLKQTSVNNVSKVVHPFNISVFLGFEADSSLNISARIRGPNDQYVNHIMNETGATVELRGHGSGNSWSSLDEERQPLHLFLTSSNPQSLERAKLLAENLMDTISREFGASRSSSNVYGAVPPPQQLASAQCYVNSVIIPPVTSAIPSQPTVGCYLNPSLTGTSYYGYGGIYPQATPLQQVALALRQSSPSLTNSTVVEATIETTPAATSSERLSSEKEKRKRKFQELPVSSANGCAKSDQKLIQGALFLKPSDLKPDLIKKYISTFLAPKRFSDSAVNEMPPPPPRTMPPPPAPKFNSPKVPKTNALDKLKQESLPDTLFKLMEYGEEDDDDDDTAEEPRNEDSNGLVSTKPFWSV